MNTALWLFWVASVTTAAQAADGDGAQWARGALEQAVAASSDVQDSFHRAQALAEIAETHAGLGQGAAALPLLQLAAESAGLIDTDALADWARHDIALAYIKAGETDLAVDAAHRIADLRLRDTVLAAVADVRRADRDFGGAIAVAREMRDGVRQGQALRSIVIAQASGGDTEAALATARSIVHPVFAAVALGDVVSAFAREGHLGEARMFAARIRDDRARSAAQIEIIGAQAESGDVESALAAAKQLEDKFARAEAIGRVAAARVRFGAVSVGRELFTQAVSLAKSTRGTAERRASALVEIARAQISAHENQAARGTLQDAATLLPGMKRSSDRLAAIQQIASLQARAGNYEGAMAIARQADDQSIQPLLVRDVAAAQAEAGDVAGAVRAALALEDRASAAAAFFGILRVQAQARDTEGMGQTIAAALRIVRVMRADELKAGALASLAAAQLIAGDAEAARLLYDEAMAVAGRAEAGQARTAAYARIADALGESRR